MNVNLVCVARNNEGRARLKQVFNGAVAHTQAVFGEAEDLLWTNGTTAIFNSNRVRGSWGVSNWYQSGGDIIAFTQPPIPVDEDATTSTYAEIVLPLVRDERFSRLLPNHSGLHRRPDGRVTVWADTLGLGRCYYVITSDFVAASNHIGALTFFLQEPATMDRPAVARFTHAGWFTGDDSPIKQIRRLRESHALRIAEDGGVEITPYFDLGELVHDRDATPDYDAAVAEQRCVARNLDALSQRTPTVSLSGGRDSRMTAAVWLSGGSNARVVTLGTLSEEAAIAQELISRFAPRPGQEVEHVVTVAHPRNITMPLEERIQQAFRMWDGDAAPTNIRGNVRVPAPSVALSIGGVGGEIMHGYYYSRPGDFEKVQALEHPVLQAKRSFRGTILTESARAAMSYFFDENYERARAHGCSGITSLDYLYLIEKFRRWVNQALGSTSAIMLSSPAYVRACFDLKPIDKVTKQFPVRVVERAMPDWDGVRYYKANPADSRKLTRSGLTTWETDPERFHATFENPRVWPEFMQESGLEKYLGLVKTNEALPSHESWLNRALWLDSIDSNISALNAAVRHAHKQRPDPHFTNVSEER